MSRLRPLLIQYEQRLEDLRCVTPITRKIALEFAESELEAVDLEWYLARVLPLIERFVDPAESGELDEFWELTSQIDDPSSLSEAFGMAADFSLLFWFEALSMWYAQRELPRSLTCIANHLALPIVDLHREPMCFCTIVAQLAELRGRFHDHHSALNVYEFVLGWDSTVFRDSDRIREDLNGFAPNKLLLLSAMTNLNEGLVGAFRYHDAESLALAVLKLTREQLKHGDEFAQAVNRILQRPNPEGFESVPQFSEQIQIAELSWIAGLSQVMRDTSPHLVEKLIAEISDSEPSVSSPAEMIRRLIKKYPGFASRNSVEILAGQFAISLTSLHRHADSVRVIEVFLGLRHDAYDSIDQLDAVFNRYLTELTPLDGGMFLIGTLSTGLRRLDRAKCAALMIERMFAFYGGGCTLDHAIHGARQRLKEEWVKDHVIGAVASWVRSLAESGDEVLAGRVAFETLGDLSWLVVEHGMVRGHWANLMTAVIELLLRCGSKDKEYAAKVIRLAVTAMRMTIGHAKASPEDRLRFQHLMSDIRVLVVKYAFDWIQECGDLSQRQCRWTEVMAWEAEIGQRTLLERLVHHGQHPEPNDAYLFHPIGVNRTTMGVSTSLNPCLERRSSQDTEVSALEDTHGATTVDSELLELLHRGISELDLASSLRDDEVLLRAGFASDGCTVWALVEKNGEHIKILSEGRGTFPCRDAIVEAIHKHDAELEISSVAGRLLQQYPDPVDAKRKLASAACALETSIADLIFTLDHSPEHAEAAWSECIECLNRHLEIDLAVIRSAFDFYYRPLGNDSLLLAWRSTRTEEARYFLSLFHWPENTEAVNAQRNSSTSRLVDSVAGLLPIDEIFKASGRSKHLVLQLDGALHSLPLSFLPVHGKSLFRHFNSVRSCFSLLLNRVSREADSDSEITNVARGLLLSWFDPSDPARISASILEHKLLECGPAIKWLVTDNDTAGHDALTAGTSSGGVRVLIVCGHGHDGPSGVMLKDGIWTGARHYRIEGETWCEHAGCDLRNVDFLIQVSCAIGRVLGGEVSDFDGFCVETAASGCRSVLAGKWPVSAVEAPVLAAEVAIEYARLVASTAERLCDSKSLRSSALSNVRCRLEGSGTVGLNTLAAFDLYGIG